MFDVNFINESGIQEPEVDKKLTYNSVKEKSNKISDPEKIVSNNKKDKEIVKPESKSNVNIVILLSVCVITFYMIFDYLGMLPNNYSFIDRVVNNNGKIFDRDSDSINKISQEYIKIVELFKNIDRVVLNENNFTLYFKYNDLLILENDRQQIIKNFRLLNSNIFVKQESDFFSMMITSNMINNNAFFFSSDPINEGIESGITKTHFVSILNDRIESKSILSSNIDVQIINNKNQSIIIPR
tara:strand:- start:509 stop:1231 length:723 start_codon:yes stop_codon:yes gene_type:complete